MGLGLGSAPCAWMPEETPWLGPTAPSADSGSVPEPLGKPAGVVPVQASLGTRSATPSECLCHTDRRAPRPTSWCGMPGVGWGRGIADSQPHQGCLLWTTSAFSSAAYSVNAVPGVFQNSEAGPQGSTTRRYCPPLAEPSIFRRAPPDKRFVCGRWLDLGSHLLQEVWWVRLGRR